MNYFCVTYGIYFKLVTRQLGTFLSCRQMGDIACDLGVTVLFAAAIAAVGLALTHTKARA